MCFRCTPSGDCSPSCLRLSLKHRSRRVASHLLGFLAVLRRLDRPDLDVAAVVSVAKIGRVACWSRSLASGGGPASMVETQFGRPATPGSLAAPSGSALGAHWGLRRRPCVFARELRFGLPGTLGWCTLMGGGERGRCRDRGATTANASQWRCTAGGIVGSKAGTVGRRLRPIRDDR